MNCLRPLFFLAVLTTANAQSPEPRALDSSGGEIIRLEGFDLQSPEARWQFQPNAKFTFSPSTVADPAHWSFERDLEGAMGRGLWSLDSFRLRPNRRYRISALIRSDFARAHSEINAVLMQLGEDEEELPGRRSIGFPAKTNGWERFEAEFVTPATEVLKAGRFGFWFFLGEGSELDLDFSIADIALVELPVAPPGPLPEPIDEVTFAGGPGALPMQVDPPQIAENVTRIPVSGIEWEIHPKTDEIVAHQRIGFASELARFHLPEMLADLEITRQDETVVVMENDRIALGFQCDGMLAVLPLTESTLRATSAIGPGFIRYGDGHLFASDGLGGFTVNPYPEPGNGRLVSSRAVTDGLDFPDFDRGDLQTLSDASPGWQIEWDLRERERIFLSAFPPRDYPWEQSFAGTWMLSGRDWQEKDLRNPYWENVAVWLLWDFHLREWGMSFGTDFIPHDEAQLRKHLATVEDLGKRSIFYTSAWFYGSRDAPTYVDAVMEEVDRFGFDGFYTDGLPAVEWLVGYEELRMLRERLDADEPGLIYVHDSVPQSGRHPAAWMPWLYTYADVTYMAEHVASDAGADWNWVRYVISGFRSSGGIGAVKGDRWTGPEFEEEVDKYTAGLLWNARIGEAGRRGHNDVYVPMRRELEALWKQKGADPNFYDRYYLPKARELTGHAIGRAAMPTFSEAYEQLVIKSVEPTATIRYTLDGSVPDESSAIYEGPMEFSGAESLRAVGFVPGLEPSPVAIFRSE